MAKDKLTDTQALRSFLLDQMQAIVSGEIDPERVRGIVNVAQQVYNTLNIEVRVATARAKHGEGWKMQSVKFNADKP